MSIRRLLVITLASLLLTTPGALAAGGSLSGTVAGSLPKAGKGAATVQVIDGDRGEVVAVARPNKRGAFTVRIPADGAYVVNTAVVAAGKAVVTTAAPISVKRGQRRKGLKLTPKRKKTKKKRASRSYVQEDGTVTAGVTAVTIENFADGTGAFGWAGGGLTALLTADMFAPGSEPACATAFVANAQDRKLVEHELELQKSKYFDPKTRVKRNFVLSDLTVNGAVTTQPGGQSATVTITINDSRTGAVVDTIQTTVTEDNFFDQESQLAKVLAERLCRRPSSYELTLAVHSDGSFATHSGSGDVNSTLLALRSGGEPGKPATAWSGVQPLEWTGLAFSSKMPDCFMSSPVSSAGTWSAQLSATADEQLTLTWGPADGKGGSSATINCTDSEGRIVSQPGMPGPWLFGVTPMTTTLPLTGGVIPLGGGFTSGGDGWTDSGTLTVRPIWASAPPA